MSYQRERDQFIATMTREGLALYIIETLLREAAGFQRRAELACSSEAADRDRVPCPRVKAERLYAASRSQPATNAFALAPCLCEPDTRDGAMVHDTIPRITLQDWHAEQRVTKLLTPLAWKIYVQGDPRGYVLRVIPPSYAERNDGRDIHNLDSIGVPTR